ncbi:MAG: CocE/NonD family hydrolase C-terminal non-catalytic domain-containing protein, partial [Parvibaculaceae bacterium]
QEWCPYGQGRIAAEGATDQREDDAGSLIFDTDILKRPINLLGEAVVKLRIASDKPQAMAAVRLCDVAPDGTSAFVTLGILNLSHRESHEHPEAMKPGKFVDVALRLKPVGQIIPKGHRLRLAISSNYWPMVWPGPETAMLTIDPSASRLDLPVVTSSKASPSVLFKPAEQASRGPVTVMEPARETREIRWNVESETATFDIKSNDGRYVIGETGTEVASTRNKTYSISRHDPLSAVTTVACHQEFKREDWDAAVWTEVTVKADRTHFHITGTVKAAEGNEVFATRKFRDRIKRDFI